MLVISTREFRERQGQYLGRAGMGETIVLKSRKEGSFKLVPITDDDTLMSKKDFFEKIDRSLQEAKEGKIYRKLPTESLSEFLKRTSNV